MSTINWDDMESAHEEASKPAPEGRYVLAVKACTEGLSKKGDPQIKIVWQIDEGPFKGKVAFDYLTLNREKPATISMARAAIIMLGFKDLREWGATDEKVRTEMLIGRRIEADLSVEEYMGRQSNKVKQKVRGLDGASVAGLTPPPSIDPLAPPAPASAPENPLAGI